MRMKRYAAGLSALSLLWLSACASGPPSPAPRLTVNICATPDPCRLPASNPRTHGDLNLQVEITEGAWAECAAKVDAIIACHRQAYEDWPDAEAD